MKCISVVCVLSALLAISLAAPTPIDETNLVPIHNQVKRQTDNSNSATLNRIITFSNSKIQMLRRLCPQLFQVIDSVVQNVTSQVFRVVGGALLRSGGLGGGGGSSSGGSGGGRVSVVLPTFPPDEDEDDDEDDEDDSIFDIRSTINATTAASARANPLSLRSELNEIDALVSSESNSTTEADTTTSASTTVVNLDEFMTSPSTSATRSERKVREANDQEVAASGGNGPNPAEDLSDVEAEESDRNKRFLPFGGDGSAGGSGNFLFDLIRNTADRAARAAGTVYRMVAGTENIGFGISATSAATQTLGTSSQLVAGSGATEETDEKTAGVGGVAEIDVSPKGNGEGIPGPITRLLVVANRGIANLIQDLILRLAQTSERIVNFKARLVTALI